MYSARNVCLHIVLGIEERYSSFVLDGEMIAWDPNLGEYPDFGTLREVSKNHHITETSRRPCCKIAYCTLEINDLLCE